jgi:hypothetical protein
MRKDTWFYAAPANTGEIAPLGFFKRRICSVHRRDLPLLLTRQIGGNAAFCGFPLRKSGARGPSQLHNL